MPVSAASVPPGVSLRAATVEDAEALGRCVIDGFAGYRAFAPAGWEPPPMAEEVAHVRRLLRSRQHWCLIAERDGALVGQIAVLPAALSGMPVDDASLAHLRNLFVHPDQWGSGLARVLHRAGVEASRERGFAAMRLFTPAAHGRARRFYEREGWQPAGEEFHAPGPDLVLIEYRLELSRPRR
ncbi:GNAT family N-acetyltransferase [Capillimicrobium parvum]|uniref:N-acetyltransferase domain-containing protein n=1 Tax=Capillimicrobium parvum TaxID=2884022 RepID=A0A9E6Y0D6_9ACTN|nr:GNAT family N-acetyltransferase [Capillimicrobium parvum]UGS37116.1 hypothetical protein DSM104329_03530 [Capillimicrobium parvum]